MILSPLQLKLQLLRSIKEGNIEQIHNLVSSVQKSTKINSDLYHKFNQFISDNKSGLLEMYKQQKQENQQPKIIIENFEGELDDDYNSDDSWTCLTSQSQEQQSEYHHQKSALEQISNRTKEKIQSSALTNNRKEKNVLNNPQIAFKKNNLKPSTSSINPQSRNTRTKY